MTAQSVDENDAEDLHSTEEANERTPSHDDRIVFVPIRLYKTITVFSTLFAVLGVVLGFVLLDRATDRARADIEAIDPLLAISGLLLIIAAAAIYAFSTRFQASQMGTLKEETDEGDANG